MADIREFLLQADSLLSEEIRYHSLRLTGDGLFVDSSAKDELFEALKKFFTKESPEKLRKKLLGEEKEPLSYLLDGKNLLIGSITKVDGVEELQVNIPRFRGSLLGAKDYIHIKDRIFSETEGVKSRIDSKGFHLEIQTRKHSLKLNSVSLKALTSVIQLSPSLSRRYPEVKNAARNAIPALAEIWSKAKVIPKERRLLIPSDIPEPKKCWFLLATDIVIVQGGDGELITAYGLRGKNLHNFLVAENDKLKNGKKRLKIGGFSTTNKGRTLGFIKLEDESYGIDPSALSPFLDRITVSRELPEKVPPRFTVQFVLTQFVKLLESSSWVDAIHVPRTFAATYPQGTNYRSKKQWIFALSKKRSVVGVYDKHSPKHGDFKRGLTGLQPQSRKKREKKKGENTTKESAKQ